MTEQNIEANQTEEPAAHHDNMQGSFFMKMNDTVGTIFLGVLSLYLLTALLRSNKRYRELLLEVRR